MRAESVAAIKQAFATVFDPRYEQEYPDWFWRYHGSLAHDEADVLRIIREFDDNFRLVGMDPADKVLLDAGCGFGVTCLVMRLLGAREVHGIEIFEPMLATFRTIVKHLPDVGGLHPRVGDVRHTGYPDDTFDFVLSNEAISHYHEIQAFLRESFRVLKPGGTLLISDANNAANPHCVRLTHRLWHQFEFGPAGQIPGVHHIVEEPYIERRRRAAREAVPALSDAGVETVARGTFRRSMAEVADAACAFAATGVAPTSHYDVRTPALDPISGQYIERLIDPKELGDRLRAVGFDARVYAYFGGAGGNPVIRAVNTVVHHLSPLSWPVGRALKAIARKPAR